MSKTIGFIGLGAMGLPMARNLAQAGYNLSVFDVRDAVASEFAKEFRARLADSPAEAANGADIVVTIVPTSGIVEQVVFDANGIANASVKPRLLIDMTSGQPKYTQKIGAQLAALDIAMIDAPVSGGVGRAVAGTLAIMVGGEAVQLESARPVLECMSGSISHVGPLGAGQALKALNNMASAAGLLIASEILWVAKKFGLNPERVIDVINSSSGMNNSTKTKVKEFILSGSYASGFSLDLMVKDLGIAVEVAQALDAEVPFATECLRLWKAANAELGVGHDHTEIAKVSANLVGL